MVDTKKMLNLKKHFLKSLVKQDTKDRLLLLLKKDFKQV